MKPPASVQTRAIAEFATVVTGGTPSTSNKDYWDGDVPWLNSGALNDGYVATPTRFITQKGLSSSSAKLMPADTVLIALTGATVGQVGYLAFEACANQSVTGVLPSEEHDSRYLYHFLRTRRQRIKNDAFGGAQPHINQKYVKDLLIPLPLLAEQKRVAGILDAADALRAKRRESLARIGTLLESTFLDMFGDPVANPMGWTVAGIVDAVDGRYGIKAGPFGSALKKDDYVGSGYRVYGQEQVIAGRFDIGDYYIDEVKFQKLRNCAVTAGDILVSLVGSYGRVLVVPEGIEPGVINPRLLKITPRQELVTSLYLATLIQNEAIQRQLESMSHGGTMGILNAGLLKQLSIPIPPLDLQHRFAAIVESVEEQKDLMRAHLAELDTLFASLQQRAFNGELSA